MTRSVTGKRDCNIDFNFAVVWLLPYVGEGKCCVDLCDDGKCVMVAVMEGGVMVVRGV